MTLGFIDAGVCLLALIGLLSVYYKRRPTHRYPPGPKPYPFIGNVLDIPDQHPYLQYAQWAREYDSPIIKLQVLGTPMYVINDLETAEDLFEKRASIYSSRPRMPMLNEAIGYDWNFAFCEDMNRWKLSRREFELQFRPAITREYRPQILTAVHDLLRRLVVTPDNFTKHIRLMVGALIMDIGYGIKVKSADDKYIEIAEKAQEGMDPATDKNIVDIFPWIQHVPSWVPGMGWKKQIDAYKTMVLAMCDVPYQHVLQQLKLGSATSSLTTKLIDRFEERSGMDSDTKEYYVKSLSATLYNAGTHTTSTALDFLFFVLLVFPDILEKSQEEIDRAVGTDRLPDFTDEQKLPYTSAVIKEILRWGAFVPTGIIRTNAADDIYKGYFIPKGSLLVPNAWAMLHDPRTYAEPEKFRPERFLTADGKLDDTVPDPDAIFGFARRMCPGRFLAFDTMFIGAACIIAAFNIGRELGPDGEEVTPPLVFTSGLVRHPKSFRCTITPRSEKTLALIHATSASE
ncbi:cytochrome P450 [Stereum hirsutum FP-91666 SS1]|uniref:cytochrome P450 n=1 Tax=Stereum hirsutum (strain FP-91666) TaxID=721885 RepID=UPI000444A80D|nr:cytochrome P450 [Stereum hirsutum FP-91666 SS1]EIM81471.1 cytochrome P450 [Stereum hirsutum FP-91666 SS1]